MYDPIRRPEDFRMVYRQGRLKFGRYLAVHAYKTGQEELKIGFSVSKKVGNAVTRNLVKRKLREIVRFMSPNIQTGLFIVIGAKNKSKDASFSDLERDLFKVMKGLDLFR